MRRALLCLAPGSAVKLPLQPSHVRAYCDALKLSLKADGHRDLYKLWVAFDFTAAPMPLPWKPTALGYQNTLTGAMASSHPLCAAFRAIHKAVHDQPAHCRAPARTPHGMDS